MTCSECQVQIFDGELDRDAVVHLAGCDDCRVLDREVRLNAAALAALREDVMPVRRARRWPWLVAAAAAVLVAVSLSFSPEPTPEPTKVLQPVAEVQVAPVTPALPVPAPARAVPVRRERPAKPAPAAEPLLVKFLTDDPDIVIYWQIDPVQGEQAL